MKLLTKDILADFKKQGYTDGKNPDDIKVIAKFFHPMGACSWFATEYNETDRIFFGYANLGDDQNAELGYFSLDEMESCKVMGLGIERDRHFKGRTLQKVLDTFGRC